MKITLLDGSVKSYDKSLTVKELASDLAISLGKATIGAVLNDKEVVASDFLIDADCKVQLITNKDADKYGQLISTTGGALAAVALVKTFGDVDIAQDLYKADEMEFGVTFAKAERMKLEELEKVQKILNDMIAKGVEVKNEKITSIDGLELNEYQGYIAQQQIKQFGHAILTTIDGLKFVFENPVCVEPGLVKLVNLQQLTGSYWLDNEKNIMLQRIHGLAAASQKEMTEKEDTLADRRSRDHRAINKVLKVFTFDPLIGAGLPIWLPNGVIIKEEIKKYLKQKEWEYDYVQVQTPVIGTTELYKISGHFDHYSEDMFQPFKGGNEEFVLKPMSCPHHIAVYKSEPRSYRDLPLRYAEHALQHRFESSGSLTGLERVRAMELTDSHIFVRPDQVEDEFKSIYKLIEEVLKTFNIEIDYLSFSVRDPKDKEKYFPDDKMWNEAEADMEKILKDLNLPYKKMVGEAAFYGPKLDIQIKTAQNHEITVSTIQLDFLQPQKFNISYIDKDGNPARPIMIHRGLIGTYERFIAILLEQTKGVLPLWLAPVQVEIIPVNEANEAYAESVKQAFKKLMIRSHIDDREERLSYKIRDAQVHKTPYQLVLGNKEQEDGTLTYREYGKEDQITVSQDEFIKLLQDRIAAKN